MNADRKIDYIELPARDLGKAKAFFGALLGWKFSDWGDDYVSFADGRLTGGFFAADVCATTDNGGVLVVIYMTDLDSAPEQVVALGGQVVKPIFSFPGGRRFHFVDPNGNEFAMWSEK